MGMGDLCFDASRSLEKLRRVFDAQDPDRPETFATDDAAVIAVRDELLEALRCWSEMTSSWRPCDGRLDGLPPAAVRVIEASDSWAADRAALEAVGGPVAQDNRGPLGADDPDLGVVSDPLVLDGDLDGVRLRPDDSHGTLGPVPGNTPEA